MMIFTFVCLRVKRDIGLPRFSLMGRLASRVDNTLRGRETRYLHASSRRRSDPINFHLNRACLKNSHPRRKTDLLSRRRSSLRTSLSVCLDATRANNKQKRSCVERKFEKYPEGGVKGSVQSRDSGQERKNARTPRVKVLGGYRSRCI